MVTWTICLVWPLAYLSESLRHDGQYVHVVDRERRRHTAVEAIRKGRHREAEEDAGAEGAEVMARMLRSSAETSKSLLFVPTCWKRRVEILSTYVRIRVWQSTYQSGLRTRPPCHGSGRRRLPLTRTRSARSSPLCMHAVLGSARQHDVLDGARGEHERRYVHGSLSQTSSGPSGSQSGLGSG